MFGNYFVTALRNILKNRIESLITIGGLALGFAGAIIILLYLAEELSYDRWVKDADQLWRVEISFPEDAQGRTQSSLPALLGPALATEAPEFSVVTRFNGFDMPLRLGGRSFTQRVALVDTNFFDIFGIDFLAGDRSTALGDNSSIVISRSMAEKYFGADDPVGKVLTVTFIEPRDFRVTGVFEDLPSTSHLRADVAIYFDNNYSRFYQDWNSYNTLTYVRLASGKTVADAEQRLKAIIDKYYPPYADGTLRSARMVWFLRPFLDIYLYAGDRGGSITAVRAFAAAAVLILIIATINYMNLATARFIRRTREISLRKVLGASRRQVITQFVGEAVLTAAIAMAIAFAVAVLALPVFNAALERSLSLSEVLNGPITVLIAGIGIAAGIGGGLYPALVASRYAPGEVLRANHSGASGSSRLRGGLVILQFAITAGLVVATGVITEQADYARNKELGFKKENLLAIRLNSKEIEQQGDVLKTRLERVPGVAGVTRSYNVPADGRSSTRGATPPNWQEPDPPSVQILPVDYEFFDVMRVQILSGRALSVNFVSDDLIEPPEGGEVSTVNSVVINEAAVKKLGFSSAEAALGQQIDVGLELISGKVPMRIVGVAKDFHYFSLRGEILPMIFYRRHSYLDNVVVRLDPVAGPAAVEAIDRIWQEMFPQTPIARDFVEERWDQQYAGEERQAKLLTLFAALAILIASMGLYGLASYSVQNRIKEIGIRKILGASVASILNLFMRKVALAVVVANAVAAPIVWYLMQGWLERFVYRIDLGWGLFSLTFAGTLLFASATVAGHALSAARANPIHAIRVE